MTSSNLLKHELQMLRELRQSFRNANLLKPKRFDMRYKVPKERIITTMPTRQFNSQRKAKTEKKNTVKGLTKAQLEAPQKALEGEKNREVNEALAATEHGTIHSTKVYDLAKEAILAEEQRIAAVEQCQIAEKQCQIAEKQSETNAHKFSAPPQPLLTRKQCRVHRKTKEDQCKVAEKQRETNAQKFNAPPQPFFTRKERRAQSKAEEQRKTKEEQYMATEQQSKPNTEKAYAQSQPLLTQKQLKAQRKAEETAEIDKHIRLLLGLHEEEVIGKMHFQPDVADFEKLFEQDTIQLSESLTKAERKTGRQAQNKAALKVALGKKYDQSVLQSLTMGNPETVTTKLAEAVEDARMNRAVKQVRYATVFFMGGVTVTLVWFLESHADTTTRNVYHNNTIDIASTGSNRDVARTQPGISTKQKWTKAVALVATAAGTVWLVSKGT